MHSIICIDLDKIFMFTNILSASLLYDPVVLCVGLLKLIGYLLCLIYENADLKMTFLLRYGDSLSFRSMLSSSLTGMHKQLVSSQHSIQSAINCACGFIHAI